MKANKTQVKAKNSQFQVLLLFTHSIRTKEHLQRLNSSLLEHATYTKRDQIILKSPNKYISMEPG